MNILITGASGFIGNALLEYIKEHKIFKNDNIILLSSKLINGYECVLHKNYTFTKLDFNGKNIDIVFHLGAAAPKSNTEFGTDYTYKFATNILNTAHLLENLPNIPKKFIFISSVSVYEDAELIKETTPLQTKDMYGASKLMCEAYLEKKSKEMGFILQILRLGQIYGEGEETYSKIVSFFVKQIANNEPITIFGTGDEKRSMLYVKDCAKCIIEAANLKEYIQPINIASNQSISVKHLLEKIYTIYTNKKNVEDIYTFSKSQNSQKNITYDTSKMQKYLSLNETSYEDGLKQYIDYYIKKYKSGEHNESL